MEELIKNSKSILEELKEFILREEILLIYLLLKPRLHLHEHVKWSNSFTRPSIEDRPSSSRFLVLIS